MANTETSEATTVIVTRARVEEGTALIACRRGPVHVLIYPDTMTMAQSLACAGRSVGRQRDATYTDS